MLKKLTSLQRPVDDHATMKSDAIAQGQLACEKYTQEKSISKAIKVTRRGAKLAKRVFSRSHTALVLQSFMDSKYGPTFHCIVGSDFKAFFTHESKSFIFFYVGKTAILLYRAG